MSAGREPGAEQPAAGGYSCWLSSESDIPGVLLNGDRGGRRPGNVNVCFREVQRETILLELEMESVYANCGSACHAGSQDPSHVLLAIGRSPALAHTARRLILGAPTIETEVERVLDLLPACWIECATRPPLSGSQLNDEHVSCFGLDRLTVKP